MSTPPRWSDGERFATAKAPAAEQVAQRLFSAGARPVPPPSPVHLAKLWRAAHAKAGVTAVGTSLSMKVALTIGALALGGGAAAVAYDAATQAHRSMAPALMSKPFAPEPLPELPAPPAPAVEPPP